MTKSILGVGALFLLVACVLFSNRQESKEETSAQAMALRQSLLLSEEPDGLLGILEARETIQDGQEVCLLGRVGGVENPLDSEKAVFILVDPSSEEIVSEGGHDGTCESGCAFCANIRATESVTKIARVEMVDATGKVLPFGAADLLAIEKGSLVVVQGKSYLDNLGYLTVKAEKIYLR